MPTRPCAWTPKPALRRHANRRDVTFRLPLRGQHRLTQTVTGGRPVSRLTACARARTRAPEVRASLGRPSGAVKETRARRAYRTGFSCAIVCARLVPAHAFACAVKRETGSAPALNLCCPRNGKRPAVQMFMLHRACVFDATVRYIRMNAGGKAKRVRPPARIPARCGGGRAFLGVTPPAAGIREGRM